MYNQFVPDSTRTQESTKYALSANKREHPNARECDKLSFVCNCVCGNNLMTFFCIQHALCDSNSEFLTVTSFVILEYPDQFMLHANIFGQES